ncbi:hypothetical protein J580_0927 [Acinetobacter sp. 1542444]|nr:hypothetical protein J580_0927 [Acinetobacter sp. 1542444]
MIKDLLLIETILTERSVQFNFTKNTDLSIFYINPLSDD